MPPRKKLLANSTAPIEEVDLILRGEHADPFHVLGAHLVKAAGAPAIALRAFLPHAADVWAIRNSSGVAQSLRLERIHPDGFFEAVITGESQIFPYRLRVKPSFGDEYEFDDPYRFPPVLSDFDLHLMGEGTHYKKYEKLGAHLSEIEGVNGVTFGVWAPNARRVSVVGDFNQWDGRRHPMRVRGGTGIWELFIPGLGEGEVYKYEIKSNPSGAIGLKADPYAFFSEQRPKTASVVHNINRYVWHDEDWLANRARRQSLDAPISIYEVHLGSWRRVPEDRNRMLGYRELADQLVDYAVKMGYTHLELLPVMEHPLDESWGYQSTGYFAPTSRHGTPEDFMYFVDTCHQNNLGVILDWVPAHFPSDAHGLAKFDGTNLYDHEDPRRGEHKDWGTRIFNFGRNEVRNFLWSSALFWLEKYHADGLRVDAVASMLYLDYSRKAGEWIPNQYGGNEDLDAVDFLKKFNELVHAQHPGVMTIAEESTAWPGVSRPTYLGGLGFSLKWNLGWMHDTLLYFSKDPIHRRFHHNNLTFSLLYAFTENFVLVLSHDEVVHGKKSILDKMPGDLWQRFANLRSLYAYMFTHPGKKLGFMGGEFGQWREWNATASLDWHLLTEEPHRKLLELGSDLNRLYQEEAALHQVEFDYTGFDWIDCNDADNSVLAYLRWGRDRAQHLVIICNFTPIPRYGYRVGVPQECLYQEALNTDDWKYGGSGVTNPPGRQAIPMRWHNQPFSLDLTLPPLGVVILKPQR
ncbi:MAG TPA: 1,4-alpha-glucan branching protein GlgB [Terriglobia bacterium]|nr:1,4-alpha-glucan branching protein GlgB [Terriglobia bacterium]